MKRHSERVLSGHTSRRTALVLVLSVIAACSGLERATARQRQASLVESSNCYIRGLSRRVRCVSMRVPLKWSPVSAESIVVAAIIVPALSPTGRAPMFVLPGGPGQGASTYGALVTTAFAPINRTRDVVLVDPRGTGRSTPFDCQAPEDAETTLDSASRTAFGRECAARAPAPPEHFTAREIIEDIEHLRLALGLPRIVVWGGSWGTRLAQFYAAAHPQTVDAVVLDAAVPVDTPLIRLAPSLANRAWGELRARCRSDRACAAAFDVSLTTFEHWIATYGAPRRFSLPDPRTGRQGQRVVSREDILEAVRGALYQPSQAAMLPLALRELQRDNLAPLLALAVETAGWSVNTQQLGALLAIMCTEEAPFVSRNALRRADAGRVFDDTYPLIFLDYCQRWPARAIPADLLAPATVQVPALVLSGSDDPVSPASQGARAAARFTKAQHLVIPYAGHINSRTSCIPSLLADFLDNPEQVLKSACLTRLPALPFALSSFGPVPDRD